MYTLYAKCVHALIVKFIIVVVHCTYISVNRDRDNRTRVTDTITITLLSFSRYYQWEPCCIKIELFKKKIGIKIKIVTCFFRKIQKHFLSTLFCSRVHCRKKLTAQFDIFCPNLVNFGKFAKFFKRSVKLNKKLANFSNKCQNLAFNFLYCSSTSDNSQIEYYHQITTQVEF